MLSEEVTLHFFLLLVLVANHIARHLILRALFVPPSFRTADSLCEKGGPIRVQPFQSITGTFTVDGVVAAADIAKEKGMR
jgi:hypothetical protein